MILCASGLRFVSGVGDPEQVIRLAADAGFDGVALGADCTRGHITALAAAALAAGLAVPVVAAPLADAPLGVGRRLPYLASLDDSDERRAAIALFTGVLESAASLGIRTLTVHLGEVALGVDAAQIAHRYARRELLDEDEPGARLWAAALGERRALSGLVSDACRYALDRILPHAERRDIAVAIEIAAGPWSAPTPREALSLLDEYGSAPVGVVWDAARMQVLTTLGIAPAPARYAALAAGATIWRATDAVGVESGYLPGLGDPPVGPGDTSQPTPTTGIPVIVAGHPNSTIHEVAEARARVATALAL
ncbi:MAG: TIM barrel protein [Deltaproteobacteria bacterium]|nr:TIM barrel protein [Deltaproteobacteria bacterium]